MSIKAIYVYAPTTFKISGKVESFTPTFAPGVLTAGKPTLLPAGVYRTKAGTHVDADGGDYEVVDHAFVMNAAGGKDPVPDPPPRAQASLKFGTAEAIQFLGGLGDETTL
ncbi:MAG: hypothetical protein WKG01_01615 [Kofleriaceae bacterium]